MDTNVFSIFGDASVEVNPFEFHCPNVHGARWRHANGYMLEQHGSMDLLHIHRNMAVYASGWP